MMTDTITLFLLIHDHSYRPPFDADSLPIPFYIPGPFCWLPLIPFILFVWWSRYSIPFLHLFWPTDIDADDVLPFCVRCSFLYHSLHSILHSMILHICSTSVVPIHSLPTTTAILFITVPFSPTLFITYHLFDFHFSVVHSIPSICHDFDFHHSLPLPVYSHLPQLVEFCCSPTTIYRWLEKKKKKAFYSSTIPLITIPFLHSFPFSVGIPTSTVDDDYRHSTTISDTTTITWFWPIHSFCCSIRILRYDTTCSTYILSLILTWYVVLIPTLRFVVCCRRSLFICWFLIDWFCFRYHSVYIVPCSLIHILYRPHSIPVRWSFPTIRFIRRSFCSDYSIRWSILFILEFPFRYLTFLPFTDDVHFLRFLTIDVYTMRPVQYLPISHCISFIRSYHYILPSILPLCFHLLLFIRYSFGTLFYWRCTYLHTTTAWITVLPIFSFCSLLI